MNIEKIDKWLDNEYGVSYTRLEELHDFVVEQDLKHREEKDKEIERLNNIINELEKELREGSFDVYFCSTNTQKTFKSNEIIIKSLILDKLKELKENK